MLESSVGLLTATISVATVVLSGGSESTSALSVATLRSLLALAFTTYTVLFLLRFVIPWFPQIKEERLPWSFVFWATESVLRSTRRLIPPQGGVDITPLAQELLVGPQGIVTILAR
ncbi:YGGT [Cyanidiococcus yangmingshanensis]|uniref:YGGT n=1 Tax=Cyanidiococcus yangmingshanensis TaxID=2690220 RepID=A0A7J7II89_9RHOD|nr:YGGT [Cyanidiococcus yangmingshanensis]